MSETKLRLYRGKYAIYERVGGVSVRRSLGTADKAEAIAMAAEARQLLKSRDKDTLPFRDLWSRYRESLGSRPAATTMKYEAVAILPVFGDLRAVAITAELCRAYVKARRDLGRKDGAIRTELNRVRACLNWSVKEGLLGRAPEIVRPPSPPPRDRHLTREEAAKLVEACAAPHMRTFVVLALTTGARMSAILELEWPQVDFVARRINLVKPGASQTAKRRAIVPMNPRCLDELQAAKARATGTHVIEFRGAPVVGIKTAFNATCRRAGLSDVSPHILRHTAAVRMAEAGRPMSEISQFLGHASTATTEKIYARYSPEYLRESASALDF